jgi:nucleoid-associated protein YgaU
MAKLTRYLTWIPSRSGRPPGHRLMALALAALLVVGSTFPTFAVAGESDSEGEGTAPPIEVPVGPPDFDPGGEETELEETEAQGDEESGAVEAEAEVELEPPAPVVPTAPDPSVETPPPAPPLSTSAPAAASEPEQPEPEREASGAVNRREPIVNQAIKAPRQEQKAAADSAASGPSSSGVDGSSPEGPAEEEAPASSAPPVPAQPAQEGRKLGGKNSYVVQPGDCLSYIAAALLPPGSDTQAIEDKVEELWRMNEARIGTGDPDLIYPGTVLRVR